MSTLRRAGTVLLAGAFLLTGGCGGGAGQGEDRQELTVLAAASLTEPFSELADRFEAEHPGVEVRTSFDSSATIATQVESGAPADVVATADPRTMQLMADAVDRPVTVARNELTLVVPRDNPAGVETLADLEHTAYVVCAPAVPCGALASGVLDRAGIDHRPRSHEVDVKAVLTKVALGEADAGLVYVSDARAAGKKVRAIALPEGARAATTYPAAVVSTSDQPDLAGKWLDLLRSDVGIRVLTDAGFTRPDQADAGGRR